MPPFYVKNKELVFPKLNKEQSMDMIRAMHDRRTVMVEEKEREKEKENRDNKTSSKANWSKGMQRRNSREFNVNGVLREARGVREESLSMPPSRNQNQQLPTLKQNMSKVKLEPILKL